MEAIFKALNDVTRRDILDLLHQKDGRTLTELEQVLGESRSMTRFGIMKHVKILEDASLVVTKRSGRFKHHYLNAVPLQEVIDRWIEPLTQKPMARHVLDLKHELEGNTAMSVEQTPDFVLETYIKTTPAALWDAIIDPDKSAAYHFLGARTEGDFVAGGHVALNRPDGSPMLTHEIIAVTPEKHVEMTFQPHWEPNAKPSRITYDIEQVGMSCKLTVMHFAIPEGQDGVKDGWARWVSGLKSYVETGEAIDFADEA